MTVFITNSLVSIDAPEGDDAIHFLSDPNLGSSTMRFRLTVPRAARVVEVENVGFTRLLLYVFVDGLEPQYNAGFYNQLTAGVWDFELTTDTGVFTDIVGLRPYADHGGSALFDPMGFGGGPDRYVVLSAGPEVPGALSAWDGIQSLLSLEATPAEGPWPLPVDLHLVYDHGRGATTTFTVEWGDGHGETVTGNDVHLQHTYPDAGSYGLSAYCPRIGYPGDVTISQGQEIAVEGILPFATVTITPTPDHGNVPLDVLLTVVTTTRDDGPPAS